MNLQHTHLLERSALEGTYPLESVTWSQLEAGQFDVHYGVIDAPPLELSVRNMNVGFKADAAIAPHKVVLGLTADNRTHARWFGSNLDSASIVATRDLLDLSTEGPSRFYQLTVDEPTIGLLSPTAPDATALLENINGITLVRDRVHAARLRTCLHRIFSEAASTANAERRVPQRMIYGTLIPLLAAAIERFEGRVVEPTKCLSRRVAAVRLCETFMREHVDATVSLLDLSAVSGMRSRSLINAFEAVTGFSPMDYLKRLRLGGVRRALQRADKKATRIIDVATDWGFWHMGHFTTYYRAMFGETPSQTLLNS
jgi:AraC family transcriptional regulator, ethanolamine operon transcriptional activator